MREEYDKLINGRSRVRAYISDAGDTFDLHACHAWVMKHSLFARLILDPRHISRYENTPDGKATIDSILDGSVVLTLVDSETKFQHRRQNS